MKGEKTMTQAQKIFSDYRKVTGLTQKEMANAFNISQSTVCKIEKGIVLPNSDIILRILDKNKKKK